jgi:phosphoglucomutase
MPKIDEIRRKAKEWLGEEFNEETRSEVSQMLEHDEKKLVDAFYKDLEFGTGGLRGVMGAGTNRMNIYTLGMATQGLSNYLIKQFGSRGVMVAVAHDCRNNSRYFAETTANIFSANGFEVFLFESLRPTPELSYAIRYYKCQAGVVITASHNPPEYNGYKAYWDDGGQVVPPHDADIIEEVRKIKSVKDIKFEPIKSGIKIIGRETDDAFLREVLKMRLNPEIISKFRDMGIVYTPIHGSGIKLVPPALRLFGFTNIISVPEQDIIDGNFPTVKSPNPEEPDAPADTARQPRAQCRREHLAIPAPDLSREPHLQRLRRDHRRLLRGLAQARSRNRPHSIDRYAKLGKHRSDSMRVGIIHPAAARRGHWPGSRRVKVNKPPTRFL